MRRRGSRARQCSPMAWPVRNSMAWSSWIRRSERFPSRRSQVSRSRISRLRAPIFMTIACWISPPPLSHPPGRNPDHRRQSGLYGGGATLRGGSGGLARYRPHEALTEGSQFIQILEQRQGLRVLCPERSPSVSGISRSMTFIGLPIRRARADMAFTFWACTGLWPRSGERAEAS